MVHLNQRPSEQAGSRKMISLGLFSEDGSDSQVNATETGRRSCRIVIAVP